MGMAAILVMWPGPFEQTFVPKFLRSLHMKFEFNWPSGFRGEDVWNCGQTDVVTGILLARLRWAKNVNAKCTFMSFTMVIQRNKYVTALHCLFLMVFNPFKMGIQFFPSNFPNFDGQNAFPPNSTGPWPRLQKGWKIPERFRCNMNMLWITLSVLSQM